MSLKNITLRINNSTETVQTQQIVGGEGGNGSKGQPLVIKALANVYYHFTDEATGFGPENIATKRVGKNLFIAFEGGDVEQPDLVIEDYYMTTARLATAKAVTTCWWARTRTAMCIRTHRRARWGRMR